MDGIVGFHDAIRKCEYCGEISEMWIMRQLSLNSKQVILLSS